MNAPHPSVDDVFAEALQQPAGQERTAYLDDACGGDAELRRRVERLLKAHDGASSFLESPAIEQPLTEASTSQEKLDRIGPYKLLHQIGEGGMGSVYLAEQQQPVQRLVALKIIKPGMDTRQVVARFEAERQTLALMDHPNIARILDAGATGEGVEGQGLGTRANDDWPSNHELSAPLSDSRPPAPIVGRPFFVMDLVRGEPITAYADAHELETHKRLQLFVTVCLGVQHAHQKGIIHCDLKPSNILVAEQDGQPTPKIIDFGIAKAIAPAVEEGRTATRMGQLLGTPQYMSPEQAIPGRHDVDTRGDVYSLGVVLYELLTGTTPLEAERLREVRYDELQRLIRDEEPPRPSDRLDTLAASATATMAESGAPVARPPAEELRGELDWIVMKALDKDRAQRYASPAELAQDIERFLRHEPVLAGPPSRWYRARKLLRRHRASVCVGLTVVVVLIGGIIGTTMGLLRALEAERVANDERDRAQVAEVHAAQEREAAIEARNAQTRARQEVEAAHGRTRAALDALTDNAMGQWLGRRAELGGRDRRFLEQLERLYQTLADARGNTESSRVDQANGNLRVAQIRLQLGDVAGAQRCAALAIDLFQQLVAEFPHAVPYRRGLATAWNDLGLTAYDAGRFQEALAAFRAALAHWDRLASEDSRPDGLRRQRIAVRYNLANTLRVLRHWQTAEAAFREVVAARTEFAAAAPDSAVDRQVLAVSIANLGDVLRDLRRLDDAASAYRQAIEILNRVVDERPGHDSPRDDRAGTNRGLAVALYLQRRYHQAERVLQSAIADYRKLAADYPSIPRHRRSLANALRGLGNTRRAQGLLAEAEVAYRESVAIHAALAGAAEATHLDAFYWSEALLGLAHVAHAQRQPARAQQLAEQAATTMQPVVAAEPRNPSYQRTWHMAVRSVSAALLDQEQHAAASAWIDRIIASRAARPRDLTESAWQLAQCAWLALHDSQLPRADRYRLALSSVERAMLLLPRAAVTQIRVWLVPIPPEPEEYLLEPPT